MGEAIGQVLVLGIVGVLILFVGIVLRSWFIKLSE